MLGIDFLFLEFLYIYFCFLSFSSCLVESYPSYLDYFVRIIVNSIYVILLALRLCAVGSCFGTSEAFLGTCSAWGFPVRFPFGRSCL